MTDNAAPSKRPDQLVSSEISFPGYMFFPLDVKFVTRDKFSYLSGDAFKAAIQLMAAAWQEKPAGSLPDDDRLLADLAGFGRGPSAIPEWQAIKNEALCDFVLCSDGRYYSSYLAPKVMETWKVTEERKAKTKKGLAKIAEIKALTKRDLGAGAKTSTATKSVTDTVTDAVTDSALGTATETVTGRREEEMRLEERRPEERTEHDRREDGEGSGRVQPAANEERNSEKREPSRRVYEGFQGVHLTPNGMVVGIYARDYPYLADNIHDHLRAVDEDLGRVPKSDRRGRVRMMLEKRNRAAAPQPEDLPF